MLEIAYMLNKKEHSPIHVGNVPENRFDPMLLKSVLEINAVEYSKLGVHREDGKLQGKIVLNVSDWCGYVV